MKKIRNLSFFLCFLFIIVTMSAPFQAAALYELPDDVSISAASAILVGLGVTQKEDVILYEKDAQTQRSPAAMVRMMVAAEAITIIREKNIDIETTTGMYTTACYNLIGGTGVNTAQMEQDKETWTIKDLLTASLIQTAADACVTLAVTLSGSQQAFVDGMNQLAAQIGCKNTSFANVHGLDDPKQYTTAYDMYLMTRYVMDFPEFEPMISLTQHTITPVSGGDPITLTNNNLMIRPSSGTDVYYSPMAFGKTGQTDQAGLSMTSVARDSGYEYLVVVMNCPVVNPDGTTTKAHYADTRKLYKWAFNKFTYETLLSKNAPVDELTVNLAWNTDTVSLVPKEDFATLINTDLDKKTILPVVTLTTKVVDAPVQKGQVYGKVELFINVDQKIGEVELVAAESVDRSQVLYIWESIQRFFASPWFLVCILLLVLLLIGYVILNVVHNRNRKRKKMKRVKKYK